MLKVPLGWMQLKNQKVRFLVALGGVGVAVVLILMQLGIQHSMFESGVRYHNVLRHDLVILSQKTTWIVVTKPFSRRRLFQARGVAGVESVAPVYVSQAVFKNPLTHRSRSIYVMGFNVPDDILDLPRVSEQLDRIQLQDVVLFDEASREEFGPIVDLFHRGGTVSAEINDRSIRVGGLFRLGTSFGINGSVLTSDMNFLRLYPERSPDQIDLGLIRLAPGADLESVRLAIAELLPDDVIILTKAEFISREQDYYANNTPIGWVFGFGVLIGLAVGTIIVYQILFADVSDHTDEYATLKAMGYTNRYLAGVVFQEAVILAVVGFVLGLGVSVWLYDTAAEATRLPIAMTPERAVGVLALTIAMCCISGLIALRKVRSADPAEIF